MPPVVRAATADDREEVSQNPGAAAFLCYECLVAATPNQVVGFLAWRRLAPGECELLQIETATPFRRQGVARRLLRELLKQENATVFLEARRSNTAALHLYESEGFTRVGVRRDYYSAPEEDAIVLQFRPC